jgi:Transposase domain (DUF772)
MLRDRYDPMDLFALVPALSLAMDPILAQLDQLLADDALLQRVKADLRRRAPHTATRGRPSTPVEVIQRLLVVKRLYHWSYEETEHFVADSLVLRQFCRLYLAPVPDDTTLLRWANLIGPRTLEALNERVVALAQSLKVTRGRKLWVDSMVVETAIHHPTDSRLVGDGVRVLSRRLRRAKRVLTGTARCRAGLFRICTTCAQKPAPFPGLALHLLAHLQLHLAPLGQQPRQRHENQQADDRDDDHHDDHFRVTKTLTAHHERGGNVALRSAQGQDPPRVHAWSAEQPPYAKTHGNEEETGEDAVCAEHGQHVVDVRRGDQQHQQNEAQVGDPIEHGFRARGGNREPGFYSQRASQRKQHEQKQ